MQLTPEVVAKLAFLIDHQLRIEPRRSSDYVAVCTCGYASVKRRNVAIALEAAQHHQEVVVRQFIATGKPWPTEKLRRADTPPAEQEFESRLSVVA